MVIRLRSYLAPSVPAALFTVLGAQLERELGVGVEVTFDATRSGPRPGEDEVFTSAEVDVAFLCATSHVWLTQGDDPAVEALAAWVPTDPRAAGRAVYYADVLSGLRSVHGLEDLVGRRVAFNDDVSLSGHHSLRLAFADSGVDEGAVQFVRSGSHLCSLELLADGEVDAAAIDANVWRRRRRETPSLAGALRSVVALGPHPAQPVVARAGLEPDLRRRIREVLLRAHTADRVAAALSHAELQRFAPVDDEAFASLRQALSRAADGVAATG